MLRTLNTRFISQGFKTSSFQVKKFVESLIQKKSTLFGAQTKSFSTLSSYNGLFNSKTRVIVNPFSGISRHNPLFVGPAFGFPSRSFASIYHPAFFGFLFCILGRVIPVPPMADSITEGTIQKWHKRKYLHLQINLQEQRLVMP